MFFSKPVVEIISERKSVRTYKDIEILQNDKSKLKDFIGHHLQTPFNSELRFEIIETGELGRDELRSLGTYGMISGAKNFIAGTVKKDEAPDSISVISKEKFIDYGFALEKIILYLTDAGFGTCWLGGTFKNAGFTKKINSASNEISPAVTPFGLESGKRALLDRMVRGVAGSKFRKKSGELFFNNDFTSPFQDNEAGMYAEPLEMVRIAPSASNKQPWRIIKDKNGKFFHMFLSRTRNYPKMPFGIDMQMIDMGIAMCHFELTCRELGTEGGWRKLESPEISTAIITAPQADAVSYIASWGA